MKHLEFSRVLKVVLLFFFPLIMMAQKATVEGTVKDNLQMPITNANVSIKGTSQGGVTDFDGNFKIENVNYGNVIFEISFVGYQTKIIEVAVDKPNTIVNIILTEDTSILDEVIVTGISNPKKKLESSIAVTTLKASVIRDQAPPSTADLLQLIPGFVAESSGGQVGNNLFARGIPSAGAYEYVQIQEDGLPIFEDGALQFANIDNFYRLDHTLSNMEAVRGGSAAIFVSGAPGGIINFISKTGTNEPKGILSLGTSSYGTMKADFNLGGAVIEDKLFYNFGGFYRVDNGVRNPGFKANKGGQFKMNLKYNFDKGFVKVNYKHLDDRNIFYQETPFVWKGDKLEGYPDFDPNYGTFASAEMDNIRLPQLNGGWFETNLSDGVHPITDAYGTEFEYKISDKVKVKNANRITKIGEDYNAIFAPRWMGGIEAQDAAYNYTYATTGENLAADVKTKRADLWYIRKDMNNFVNNLVFDFTLDKVDFNVGYYYSAWSSQHYWNWNSFLVTADDTPRLVDKQEIGTGMMSTYHGVSQITWLERAAKLNGNVNALFANADIEASEILNINVGLRYDFDTYNGYRDNAGDNGLWGSYNIGALANSTADDATTSINANPYTHWDYDVNELSWTAAANLKINNNMASYIRASRGFRSPIEEAYYDGASNIDDVKPTYVNQYELGFKGKFNKFNVFASAFYMDLSNVAYLDIVAGGVSEGKWANVKNLGLELEIFANLPYNNISFNGTFQNPQYKDFEGVKEDLNGNQARRIPKMYFTLRDDLKFNDNFGAYAKWSYFGKKFHNMDNTLTLPTFNVVDMGINYTLGDLRFAIDGYNLFNAIGITEGDDGNILDDTKQDGDVFYGRSILGRSFTAGVTLSF